MKQSKEKKHFLYIFNMYIFLKNVLFPATHCGVLAVPPSSTQLGYSSATSGQDLAGVCSGGEF